MRISDWSSDVCSSDLEHVEAREGRSAIEADVLLQRDHAGQLHLEAGRAHDGVVFRHDVHAIEEDRLDGVLPGPQRQREITQRTEVGVEDESRIGLHSTGHARSILPPSVSTGRQALWTAINTKCHPQAQDVGIRAAVNVMKASSCAARRSEEHTSELQSLMRISYAVF